MLSKLVNLIKVSQYHIFLSVCIVLVAVISYNFGQINSLKKTPISIKESADLKAEIFDALNSEPKTTNPKSIEGQTQNSKIKPQKLDTRVVVSKNSDKYHYSWCSGAKKIKPENQIWFTSAQEAESKGYILAGNCGK